MTTESRINEADDQFPFDGSEPHTAEEAPMTETERTAMEHYAQRCMLEPGSDQYERYEQQRTRELELPDLFEEYADVKEAEKKYSRRVRAYIPWDLAREWQHHHHTARSASVLLQEAIRAELDRTSPPQVCEGCGGKSIYQGVYFFGSEMGSSSEVFYDLYTCTSCMKSQDESIQTGYSPDPFRPAALEEYELWRHDYGIVWHGEGEDEPSVYELALKGFLRWTEYIREQEKNAASCEDPDSERAVEARAGKQVWDALMAHYVEQDEKATQRQKDFQTGMWAPELTDDFVF